MANTIKLRRSAVANAVPTTSQLQLGELAINTNDGKLFLKKDDGTPAIVEIGAAGGGSMTYPDAGIAVSTGTAWSTSLTAPSGTLVGTSDTQTLTNKRINSRTTSITSGATITPTADASDVYIVSALDVAATIATPSGSPVDGQRLMLRFEDNGTGRALTWTTSAGAYRAVGLTLPTTTTATKALYVGCMYNAADGYWDVIAKGEVA